MKLKLILAANLLLSVFFVFVGNDLKGEWQIRPREIIEGLKSHFRTLWQLDKDFPMGRV